MTTPSPSLPDNPANTPSQTSPPPSSASPIITVDSLQSLEQLRLLDEIDKLRAYGVNDFVSLPQLVVCGDQSSGKSSVLEAITEIPFPRKDNLCTRFATQIVLRRGPKTKVLVKILADSKRPEDERKKLGEFTGSLNLENFGNLPALIEAAQEAMGIAPGSVAFSRDVLSIEITGPKRPQLTIVDLPGLTHSESKSQSREDVQLVSDLVLKYMRDPRTIILAIITAKNDYANQIILKRAKEVDPEGVRTLGIITKPDMLPVGSDSEDDFLILAKNEDIFFKLGWHVLRNRSYEERDFSFEDRNRVEQIFFGKGVWIDLPRDTVGISALRSRLSLLLLNCIKQELPRVYQEISDELEDCKSQLRKLGQQRSTVYEQRVFLSKISESFGRLCKAAIDGIYEDEFFGDTTTLEGQLKRLRAVIRGFNSSFAEKMQTQGYSKQIVDEKLETGGEDKEKIRPEQITQKEAILWVKPLLLRSRGRELPGTYNPLLISELFWEQSKPWEPLAQNHLDKVWKTCRAFLQILLRDIVPVKEILDSLFTYWIDGEMRERFDKASKELKSLLTDRRRHAITYNHYYIENMQMARKKRLEQQYIASIKSVAAWDPNLWGSITIDPSKLLDVLAAQSLTDMDDYACDEVLDGMTAFYKTASQVFIDNVAVQVIERQVLSGLWDIFSPSSVTEMTAELIANIAAESTEDQHRRDELKVKERSLQMGLEVCRGALKDISSTGAHHSKIQDQFGSFISSDNIASLLAGCDFGDGFSSLGGGVLCDSKVPAVVPLTPLSTPVSRETTEVKITGESSGGPKSVLGGAFPVAGSATTSATWTTPRPLFQAENTTTRATPASLFSTKPMPGSLFAAGPAAGPAAVGAIPGSLFSAKPATPGFMFAMGPVAGSAVGGSNLFGDQTKVPHQLPATGTKDPPYYATRCPDSHEATYYQTITFMPAYLGFSVEELRLRDYEIGNRGPKI